MPQTKPELGNLAFLIPQESYVDSTQTITAADVKTIQDYVITDASTNYGTTMSASMTSQPVSNQTDKADHYRINPQTFKISGIVSATFADGLDYKWSVEGGSGSSYDRPQVYIKKIKEIVKGKQLVTVYMPHGMAATNCMITSASFTKTAPQGNLLKVELEVKQLEVIQTGAGAVQTKSNAVLPQKDAGTQSARAATA